MNEQATPEQIAHVAERIAECGYTPHIVEGATRTIIGAIGSNPARRGELEALCAAPGVAAVKAITHPYKLVSRQLRDKRTEVKIGNVKIGGDNLPVVIAGPCSVESQAQIYETALEVGKRGAQMLRGGAYKPRTSPYEFQGLGEDALRFLRRAGDAANLPVVTEVMATEDVALVSEYADMLQIGARNMQNFPLLRAVAKQPRPVLLKRAPSATIKEWLLAAEYLLAGGNANVVLCERGIKGFEPELRNTLDLAAVALVRQLSHLPIIADPSHGTGRRDLIAPMTRAAVAAGADGVMIEVHPCPEKAMSDGAQSLDFAMFAELMNIQEIIGATARING